MNIRLFPYRKFVGSYERFVFRIDRERHIGIGFHIKRKDLGWSYMNELPYKQIHWCAAVYFIVWRIGIYHNTKPKFYLNS